MEKWKRNGPPEAAVRRDKEMLSTNLIKGFEDVKGYNNTERSMDDNFLPSINDNRWEEEHKHLLQRNVKSLRSEAKTDKAKTLSTSGAKREKQHIPDFPWKWDLPDIQSTPMERHTRRKKITKNNKKIEANYVTQEANEKVKELNDQISWIFEGTSESETELSTSNKEENEDESNKKGRFDEKFRDHLMKELLKQGKDMKWFVAGTKKALDNLQKGEHAHYPSMKSAARVSQELNQFLTKSMRPYYQEKKRGKRTKKKLPSGKK